MTTPTNAQIVASIHKALAGRPDALTSAHLREAAHYKGPPGRFMWQIQMLRRRGEIIAYAGDTPAQPARAASPIAATS